MAARSPASLAAPFVFAAVLFVFVRGQGLVSDILRTPPLLWLGSLSYGIYVVQIFVQARIINAGTLIGGAIGLDLVGPFAIGEEAFHGFGLSGGLFGTLMLAVMIVLVVATAWIGSVLVERPALRLAKRWTSGAALRPSRHLRVSGPGIRANARVATPHPGRGSLPA